MLVNQFLSLDFSMHMRIDGSYEILLHLESAFLDKVSTFVCFHRMFFVHELNPGRIS